MIRAPLEEPVAKLLEPFQEFVRTQTASGWLLLAATVTALVAANSPLADEYQSLTHAGFGVIAGDATLSMSARHWVNEGLMALFFFLLGLELKREVLVGRLAEPRRAASVLTAAAGGMVVPAVTFLLMADLPAVREAWAIPMATDTAFALTLLVLLGERVPAAARSFLVGLAIVDDLGAILVIALVYSGSLDTSLLIPALCVVGGLLLMNLTGVRHGLPYLLGGCVLWILFLEMDLHGTLPGVLVALMAPVRPEISRRRFVASVKSGLTRFQDWREGDTTRSMLEAPEQQEAADELMRTAQSATVPLRRWEKRLDRPISMIVVPLFAFLNAGVVVDFPSLAHAAQSGLGQGVVAGLMIGKPLGILLGLGVGRLTGLALLPEGLSWQHLLGLGFLGGVGFTMSLFISTLSFGEGSMLMTIAKQSVIVASLGSGLIGYLFLRWLGRRTRSA